VAIRAKEAPTAVDLGRQLELLNEALGAPEPARADLLVPNDSVRRSNDGRARMTLAEAARIMREAVKDKSYRSTPVGLEVAQFIRWFRREFGATAETLRDYEAILAKLALDHADLELHDFEPPAGTTRLREFIDERWGDAAPARARRCAPS
jgi:hypothetical protein